MLNARITAIEDNSLVLKLLGTGEIIRWPLSCIPQPFEMSENMTLELRPSAGEQTPSTPKTKKPSSNATLSDDEKRKLLESLIN